MSDIIIRISGRAGHITLNRPEALNALTHDMVLAIDQALENWRNDDRIKLVLLDATGDRAFCAGGDIADIYASGQRGDPEYGRKFWRDEYRLNANIFEYPKPIVSFLQGFTMGGGVGIGCHGTHRIVGETSQIAMPECSIGLVPDVGGSLMLALAPGKIGYYLGMTGARMDAGDAIYAGFADIFMTEPLWEDAKERLTTSGDPSFLKTQKAPDGTLVDLQDAIYRNFNGDTAADILRALKTDNSAFATKTLEKIGKQAPLACSCSVQILHRLRSVGSIRQALDQEFRYTARAVAQGDFIEGIRALIIDRDHSPKWAHSSVEDVPAIEVSQMLMPLKNSLQWENLT